MKNFIILLSFVLISSISYASSLEQVMKDSTGINSELNSIPDSAKVTFSTVYNDVKSGIAGLASALKVGAEHVYEVLVRQQLVNSISMLIVMIVCFISILNFFKAYKNANEKWIIENSYSGAHPTAMLFVRVVQICISGVAFIVMMFNIPNIVTGFVNPEYGAIMDIMNFATK